MEARGQKNFVCRPQVSWRAIDLTGAVNHRNVWLRQQTNRNRYLYMNLNLVRVERRSLGSSGSK